MPRPFLTPLPLAVPVLLTEGGPAPELEAGALLAGLEVAALRSRCGAQTGLLHGCRVQLRETYVPVHTFGGGRAKDGALRCVCRCACLASCVCVCVCVCAVHRCEAAEALGRGEELAAAAEGLLAAQVRAVRLYGRPQ